MPRKKRIAILTLLVILIIAIIIGILSIIYLKTDIFQSKETLFAKYFMQNFDAIEILSYEDELGIKNILENNKYESEITGKIQYTENIGTSGENQNSKINDVGVEIKSTVDKQNNYNYRDISIKNKNEDLIGLEYLNQNNDYGIRLYGIQQFVIQENEKENEILQQLKLNKLNEISIDIDISSIFKFTKEEKQTIINTYMQVIKENISKDKYYKQSNSLITINNQDLQTNAYFIKLTVEQYNNLYIKILEQITKDEIILSKIDLLESKISEINETDITLRETFINKINEKISKIQNNNIGSEEVKITVYENNKKTVRTSIEKATNKLVIDLYNNSSIKIDKIQIGNIVNEQFIKIEKEKNDTQSNVLIEFEKIQDNEVTNNIKLEHRQLIENSQITKNTELIVASEKYQANMSIENNISLVDNFEEQIELEGNVVKLDDLPDGTLEAIANILNENIQEQLNTLFSVVTVKDYTTMFKNIELIKSGTIELPDEIQVTDIERKRFNSQFEFFETGNLSTDNIKDLMQVAENNILDIKVCLKNGNTEDLDMDKMSDNSKEASDYKKSITEIELVIKQDANMKQKYEDMLKFLDDNKSNVYTVSLEYDDDGLVSGVKMKIQGS